MNAQTVLLAEPPAVEAASALHVLLVDLWLQREPHLGGENGEGLRCVEAENKRGQLKMECRKIVQGSGQQAKLNFRWFALNGR